MPELQTNAIPMTVKKGSTSGRLQRLLCNSGIPLCFEIGTHIQRGVARFDTNLQKWWSRGDGVVEAQKRQKFENGGGALGSYQAYQRVDPLIF